MNVRAVGLVGGGTMGQGIAITCAAAGLDVLLRERSPQAARAALDGIAECLDNDIAKWRRTEAEKKAILARVRVVESYDALEAAQLVMEAVSEDLELKASIFQELDRVCPPEDILATNTSALSVSEIAARTRRTVSSACTSWPRSPPCRWWRSCAAWARRTRPSAPRWSSSA